VTASLTRRARTYCVQVYQASTFRCSLSQQRTFLHEINPFLPRVRKWAQRLGDSMPAERQNAQKSKKLKMVG